MRKFSTLLISVIFLVFGSYADDVRHLQQNPNIGLSAQDAPIFYDNNPLTGLKSFVIVSCFALKSVEIQKKINQSIETLLQDIGSVIHLKDNDMRGFGAGNVLLIQMNNVNAWDGSVLPLSRASLSVENIYLY